MGVWGTPKVPQILPMGLVTPCVSSFRTWTNFRSSWALKQKSKFLDFRKKVMLDPGSVVGPRNVWVWLMAHWKPISVLLLPGPAAGPRGLSGPGRPVPSVPVSAGRHYRNRGRSQIFFISNSNFEDFSKFRKFDTFALWPPYNPKGPPARWKMTPGYAGP